MTDTRGGDVAPLALEKSILIVQREALLKDDAIRERVVQAGFRIVDLTVVQLTAEKASTYYHDKLHKPDDVAPTKISHRSARSTSSTPRKGAGGGGSASPSPRPVATPTTSPRPPSPTKTPRDESPEDAIAALSSGPVLVLLVEKANAVKDLQELVGPAIPSSWPPTSLRGQFGQDAKHVGVRCSQHAFNVSDEIGFLFGTTHHLRDSKADLDGGVHALESTCWVSLDALMQFLFPPNVQHANSTGRLFVFALYGPLDSKSRLRSGEKGLHVVTDGELDTMCLSMEREDILSVYGMIGLSRAEEEQVLGQADQNMKDVPRYTRADIQQLFRTVPRNANGLMSFHDMQEKITKERLRRIVCMKDKLNPCLAPPIVSKYRHAYESHDTTAAKSTMFLKDVGLNGSENAVLVSRLLHRRAFQICHLHQANSPDLTQNVRLLRDAKSHGHATPWNDNHAFSRENH
ncbi:unnamed protein product [Aphanomyces euteiches]|uniref:Nucleoside diphosphate kinase-like domain-containing protein n=1 Tax=Aphanomyces euteiches TaxID=100861 RepID=A0A6G0WC23_9STRA|nr:hypothetical protein Ae201684_017322 [Aphanomyces euteiches]KAH9153485.1 hypothetical protein AeRB84_004274 [Aphanomyces euteiches]